MTLDLAEATKNQRRSRFRGRVPDNDNDDEVLPTVFMAPAFAAGISQRKGKSPNNNQSKNELKVARGDSADENLDHKSLSPRSKRRVLHKSRTTTIALIGSLATILYLWRSGILSNFVLLTREKNPGWGQHPRVAAFTAEVDADAIFDLIVYNKQRDGLPKMTWTVKPLAYEGFFDALADSDSYDYGRADEFETDICKAQYDWQLHSFPSCNLLHEREMDSLTIKAENEDEPLSLVGHGYWRDVWILPSTRFDRNQVLKTIRYEHDYVQRNYERHRRDALAMERLTKNPFVVDIYAFCGNSGVFEYANGGDIADTLWPRDPQSHRRVRAHLTDLQRLHIGKYTKASSVWPI